MTGQAAASPAAAEIELVAGPFPRVSAVAAFCTRLAALPGVQGVRLQRFGSGTIVLAVRHSGGVPFAVQLRGMRELGVDVVPASASRIEVRVRSS